MPAWKVFEVGCSLLVFGLQLSGSIWVLTSVYSKLKVDAQLTLVFKSYLQILKAYLVPSINMFSVLLTKLFAM